MKKKFSTILAFFLLGCFNNKTTLNDKEAIDRMGVPIKIEHYNNIAGEAFRYNDTASFIITDKDEVQSAMKEIMNATNPEPWKGAGWYRIKIYYADTILILHTDNKKIGLSASSTFYFLSKNNFISKRTTGN